MRWTRAKNIMGSTFWSQIGKLSVVSIWSHDRNWSQTIANDCRIADDRRSVFPYDRRRSQNFLRSAIRDPRSSAIIWKSAFRKFIPATFRQQMKNKVDFLHMGTESCLRQSKRRRLLTWKFDVRFRQERNCPCCFQFLSFSDNEITFLERSLRSGWQNTLRN